MKFILSLTLLITFSGLTAPEDPMQKLSVLNGNWQGKARIQHGAAGSHQIAQYEKVRYVLDGRVMLINGTGIENGDTSFAALGVLSYDENAGAYSFRAFLADGQQADAYFKVIGENKMEWGFEVPRGKIKYFITIEDNGQKWIEKGYFYTDENTSYLFFDMELQKV